MAVYSFCGWYGKSYAVHIETLSWLDQSIPFWRAWIWVYLSQYLMIPICFKLTTDPLEYTRLFYGILFSLLICAAVFLIYPTTMLRPENSLVDGLDCLRYYLYKLDEPTNCFPSLHVTLAILVGLYASHHKALMLQMTLWSWSILIILSTLTFKQHYVLDVLGGVFVAIVAHRLTLSIVQDNC